MMCSSCSVCVKALSLWLPLQLSLGLSCWGLSLSWPNSCVRAPEVPQTGLIVQSKSALGAENLKESHAAATSLGWVAGRQWKIMPMPPYPEVFSADVKLWLARGVRTWRRSSARGCSSFLPPSRARHQLAASRSPLL